MSQTGNFLQQAMWSSHLSQLLRVIVYSHLIISDVAASQLFQREVAAPGLFASITPSTSLQWHPCLTGFSCAVLDVPLDYTKPTGTRAYVPLLKYPSSTTPYKGMVLLNPGGPGNSAIDFASFYAPYLAPVVGSNYDLVAWEPRGIGYSVPLANCSTTTPPSPLNRRLLYQPYGPRLPDKFFQDEFAYMHDLGAACKDQIGGPDDIGQHMNTGIVVKDAISILDAYAASSYSAGVSNPKLFNYWGFSYGTIIGQVLASTFPNRVGRVALDGVIDGDDWRNVGANGVPFADTAFSTFFTYCNRAGASACPYYTGSTARNIFERFERTVLKLDAKRAFENNWANTTAIYIGLEAVKLLGFTGTYDPINTFPVFAQALVTLESIVQDISIRALESLEAQVGVQFTLHPPGSMPQYKVAVGCSDSGNILYGKSLEDLKPRAQIIQSQSYIGGEIVASLREGCAGWNIPGKGRFTGKFGGNTKNPILFVSNTRDPVAPITNGIKAITLFKSSQLLTIDGTGHLSLATQNTCAFAKIGNYFQTGNLPGLNFFCPLEKGPFGVNNPGPLLKTRQFQELQSRVQSLGDRMGW